MAQLNAQELQLHGRFKFFGQKHLEFRRKCIGLLPQIFREKIYEKKSCGTIFEYAAKYAGLSQEQVKLTLRLGERFENMSALKSLLENGENRRNCHAGKSGNIGGAG